MFGKRRSTLTIIGKDDQVEGTLKIHGRLHLDGQVTGNVVAEGHVSVNADGLVLGEIRAEDVAIAGRVEGSVRARGHLHMMETGVVKGDAFYGTLQVDRGGKIEGQTRTEAGSPAPKVPSSTQSKRGNVPPS